MVIMNVGKMLYSSGIVESKVVYSERRFDEDRSETGGDHYYWKETEGFIEIKQSEYDARVAQFYADNPDMELEYGTPLLYNGSAVGQLHERIQRSLKQHIK